MCGVSAQCRIWFEARIAGHRALATGSHLVPGVGKAESQDVEVADRTDLATRAAFKQRVLGHAQVAIDLQVGFDQCDCGVHGSQLQLVGWRWAAQRVRPVMSSTA
jgi:hypothetical protein